MTGFIRHTATVEIRDKAAYTYSMSETSKAVAAVIKAIPKGKVSTYGRVASMAGLPNGARTVVRILHACTEREQIPWHRIVKADGRIALPDGGGFELQKSLLESVL